MLTSKRFEMGSFKLNLVRTDIVPIVNYAWQRSFSNVENNLKAIADRGWGPLNRILLSHHEIISSKITPTEVEENAITSASISDISFPNANKNDDKKVLIEDLNFNSGFAGKVIQTILQKAQRDQQILKNISLSNEKGCSFLSSMESAKKFTAGVIFKHGKCYLDQDVLAMAENAKQKKENQYKQKVSKHFIGHHEKMKQFDIAIKVFEQWESKNKTNVVKEKLPLKVIKPLVAWKKQKTDAAMPSKLEPLLKRWEETKHRPDLTFEQSLRATSFFESYKKETG